MEIKVSWTLVQDERIFENVFVVSKFHEDVFWIDETGGCFNSFKTRPILCKDFTRTIVECFHLSILPCVFEIRTPSYAIEIRTHHVPYESLRVRQVQSFFWR